MLNVQDDGSFTIVQFTDLHWQNGDREDLRTQALMERVLDAECPGLVVLTGDVIEGAQCAHPASAWRRAVAAMEERMIPWAAVFGNHDDEGSLSRAELMAVQQSCPMCLSEPGPRDVSGVGNYVLTIRSARTDLPAAVLYFLDSGGNAPSEIGGYAWITQDQIAWFLRVSGELAQTYSNHRATLGGCSPRIPALAFFHIPLPEYNQVWDHHPCRGHKYESVCSPRINSGFFRALCEAGDCVGTFVGHDHVNDYEGTLDGIRLCYGRASGFNTYGRSGFARGARVIRLREGERAFATWLRLEDGSVVT